MQRQINALESENARLERELAAGRERIGELEEAIVTLQSFENSEGATIFDPAEIRIGDLSGVRNLDGSPGEDGLVVYVVPVDAVGHVVTVGGAITVQILDNSDMQAPRVVGYARVETPAEVARAWHGRFMTNHFTINVPWLADASPPSASYVEVHVEFASFLTGRTLRTHKSIPIDRGSGSRASGDGA